VALNLKVPIKTTIFDNVNLQTHKARNYEQQIHKCRTLNIASVFYFLKEKLYCHSSELKLPNQHCGEHKSLLKNKKQREDTLYLVTCIKHPRWLDQTLTLIYLVSVPSCIWIEMPEIVRPHWRITMACTLFLCIRALNSSCKRLRSPRDMYPTLTIDNACRIKL
jgi:hypothetical protein